MSTRQWSRGQVVEESRRSKFNIESGDWELGAK